MEAINTMITDLLGPFGGIMIVGMLGVLMILVTAPFLLRKQADPLDRLKAAPQTDTTKDQKLRTAQGKDKLDKYSSFLEPQNKEEFSAVKLKLLQAGYHSKNAVRMYTFVQFTLGILGLVIGAAVAVIKLSQGPVETQNLALMIMMPALVGYMGPKYWVTRRQSARIAAITEGFPDSLDMLLVCVEAGQSLDQSILRVSQELRSGFPDLSYEFEVVSNELKAGKDKTSVLKDLSERVGVGNIRSFVTVSIQSQQFGTSISDALRVYGAEMRDKRVMRAEEAANKLPTKMTLATMMLTLPPLMIILVGPSIYSIIQNM